jgi:hypothetical protein
MRIIAALLVALASLAGATGTAAAVTGPLPLCSEVDLTDWSPKDGQVCVAEDDPGVALGRLVASLPPVGSDRWYCLTDKAPSPYCD